VLCVSVSKGRLKLVSLHVRSIRSHNINRTNTAPAAMGDYQTWLKAGIRQSHDSKNPFNLSRPLCPPNTIRCPSKLVLETAVFYVLMTFAIDPAKVAAAANLWSFCRAAFIMARSAFRRSIVVLSGKDTVIAAAARCAAAKASELCASASKVILVVSPSSDSKLRVLR